MEILEAKIVQVSGRSLLFRKCSKCKGKVTFVAVNNLDPGRDVFYCEKCKMRINEFNSTLKLNLTVMDIFSQKLEQIVAYNEVVVKILGCSPAEFEKHLKQDPQLIPALENYLTGLYCTIEIHTSKKSGGSGGKKARNITFDDKDIKIMEMITLLKPKDFNIDPLLSTLTV